MGIGDDRDATLADRFKAVEHEGRGLDASRMLESLSAKLFDDGARISVGRFEVRERLGAGGMGIVMSAHDPQLQRVVAVKVLHDAGDPAEQKRLLEEARAMARVAHPNLVTVYEAGTHDDSVFIAMEFVERGTLNDWLAAGDRSWRQVVQLFVGAAQGLAAIHKAGMVHRDFKPDNVLIGDDGRALVSDFGLARPQHAGMSSTELEVSDDGDPVATLTRGVAGTPGYVAPEQWRGEGADARSDQWSFFVALHEALYGARPFEGKTIPDLCMAVLSGARVQVEAGGVPTWLEDVIDRGLSRDPTRRFPSMTEVAAVLLARLDDRRGRTIRVALGAALISATAAGVAMAAMDEDPCRAVDARLASAWTAQKRDSLATTFAEASGSEMWSVIEARLDQRVRDWSEQRREACEATHARGEQSADALDLRMRCLDRRANEIEALLSTYADVQESNRHVALRGLDNLPPIAECADVEFLRLSRPTPESVEERESVAALRKRLDQLSAQLEAGQLSKDDGPIAELLADAEALGYEPAVAEVLALQGKWLSLRADGEGAAARYGSAFEHALATHHLQVQVWSSVVLVYVHGHHLRDYEAAQQWGRQAKALLRAHGHFPTAARALHNNLGVVAQQAGKREEARAHYEVALRLLDEAGLPSAFNGIAIEGNLGILARTEGRFDDAARRLKSARERAGQVLGSGHPMVGQLGNSLALAYVELGRIDDAKALYRESIAALEGRLGPEAKRLCHPLNNLAELHLQQGELDTALSMLDRALAIWLARTPDDPEVIEPLLNRADILLRKGQLDDARDDLKRAAEIEPGMLTDDRRAFLLVLQAELLEPTEPARARALIKTASGLEVTQDRVLRKLEAWRTSHPEEG